MYICMDNAYIVSVSVAGLFIPAATRGDESPTDITEDGIDDTNEGGSMVFPPWANC